MIAQQWQRIGVSEQAKTMKLSDGREVKDPFALQKALSKAQRNALRIFIPESAIEEAYEVEVRRLSGS
jgi:hypothetical protein